MATTEKPDVVAVSKALAKFDFNLHKHSFVAAHSRGDGGAADFETGDLIQDTLEHEFDLSGIVPEGYTEVIVWVWQIAGALGRFIRFYIPGGTGNWNIFFTDPAVAGTKNLFHGTIFISPARKIAYRTSHVGQIGYFVMRITGWR